MAMSVPFRAFRLVALAALMQAPFLTPSDAGAQGTGRLSVVTVMPFDYAGVAPDQAVEVSRRVHAELAGLRRFALIDPVQAEEFVKEADFRQEACAGIPCARRLGLKLGVEKVVMGKVTGQDATRWSVSAELIDVATGRVERSASYDHVGAFGDLMDTAPKRIALQLTEESAASAPAAAVASPKTANVESDTDSHPRSGFGLYTGYANYTSKAKLKDGGSLIYSGDAFPSLGLEYQWILSDPWTLAIFLESSGSSQPSGKLGKIYDSGGPTLSGVELRYWRDRWYIGGNLGSVSTCFYNLEEKKPKTPDLCFYGTAIGAAAGYQWPNGWFIGSSLEYVDMATSEAREDPRVPKTSTAVEYDWWLNVGYRWGQQ